MNSYCFFLFICCFFIIACQEENTPSKPDNGVFFENQSVQAILNISSDEAWVSTLSGFYRCSSGDWQDFSDSVHDTVNDIAWFGQSLWLATNSGIKVAAVSENGINISTTYDASNSCLKSNKIAVLEVSPDGILWAGSEKGLCYFEDNQWKNDIYQTLRFINVSSMAFKSMEYYFGTYGQYLYHYYLPDVDGISGASYLVPEFNGDLSSDTVFSVLIDQDDNLWFGSTSGLTRNEGDTHVAHGVFRYFLEGIKVHALLQNQENEVIAGTNDGLFIVEGNGTRQLTSEFELPGNTVNCLTEDIEGNIWIGTNKGLVVWGSY